MPIVIFWDIGHPISYSWEFAKNNKLSYEEVKLKDSRVKKLKARSQFLAPRQFEKSHVKARKKKIFITATKTKKLKKALF